MINFDVYTHPFTSKLRNLESTGTNKWKASCNCDGHKNNDADQSLSVAFDPVTGRILVHCFVDPVKHNSEAIVSSYGCTMSDLFVGENNGNQLMRSVSWYAKKNNYRIGDIYPYSYPPFNDGLYKVRFYKPDGKKSFSWVHKDTLNRFGYTWSHKGLQKRLYVSGNISDDKIILVEGEKDADTAHILTGLTAVSAEDGATLGDSKTDKKWCPEYTDQLSGKDVYILYDNDEAGINFAIIEAEKLLEKAGSVRILKLNYAWSDCPEKGDISDLVNAVGESEAKAMVKKLMDEAEPIDTIPSVNDLSVRNTLTLPSQDPEQEEGKPDESLPEWLMETEYNGRITRKINEPVFCEMFRSENAVARINGVFYLNGEQVPDDMILSMIQKIISPYFPERTGRRTADLFVTLQNTSFVRQPSPDERKFYCADDLTIEIDDDGILSFTHENVFTLSRLAVKYNPESECPVFMKYLNDMLYPEDIPAVQEYIGYCLIPSTRAQAGLFIHGQGGEGKSILSKVLMRLFSHGAVQEGIHELAERFIMANLENKLICIDDDMKTDKLSDTAVLKKLITNSPQSPIQVERKNRQKYDAFIYARVFAIGNSFIGSKFDHSDGFYRRQLLIDCKPKTRPEDQDDRRMDDKCIAEIEGILNWAISGLIRLVRNGYRFTVSDRMKRTLDDVKHEGNNALSFFEDDSVFNTLGNSDDELSSADLFKAYALWCYDNAETPMRKRSFLVTLNERFKIYKKRLDPDENKIRRQGFSNIRLTANMKHRVETLDEKTAAKIDRLP